MIFPLNCSMVGYAQWGVAVFSALAAAFWLVSALIRTPSTEYDEMRIGSLGDIGRAMKRQSRWSAAAAVSAAIAAVVQILLVGSPACTIGLS